MRDISVKVRSGLWLSVAALSLSAVGAAHAQAAEVRQVDIPAQSLATTLNQIGRQTGSEVVFASADVRGKKAPAVRGSYSADEALRVALQGTSLSARRTTHQSWLPGWRGP